CQKQRKKTQFYRGFFHFRIHYRERLRTSRFQEERQDSNTVRQQTSSHFFWRFSGSLSTCWCCKMLCLLERNLFQVQEGNNQCKATWTCSHHCTRVLECGWIS